MTAARVRLWFTLGALIVYRIGSYLPIPGLDLIAVDEFRHIAFLTGGVWIPDLSIFSLGIMPYISAVVLVELVKHFVPRLGGLAMAGPEGRRKLISMPASLRWPWPLSRPSASPLVSRNYRKSSRCLDSCSKP